MTETKQRVVVLGASDNPDRYSNMAVKRLLDNGHEVVPVHPVLEEVEGLAATAKLDEVAGRVDTITIYVSPKVSSGMADAIIAAEPRRVIFNPGAENGELEKALGAAGIETLRACTLVLLSTGQF